jgi:hypothetical protein
MPIGFEERLLAPRRHSWAVLDGRAAIKWHLNTLKVDVPGATGPVLQSEEIPVEPGRELRFQGKAEVRGAAVGLRLVGGAGETVSELDLPVTKGPLDLDLPVSAPPSGRISVQLVAKGDPSEVLIDFQRVRTPCDFLSAQFRVPGPRRWQLCTDAASVTSNGSEMRISSQNGGAPYLLKSYAIPCAPNELYVVPVDLEIHEGKVNLAILSRDESRFLESFSFYKGKTSSCLFFYSESNDRVRLVVSANPGEPVDACIQWPETVPTAQQRPFLPAIPTGTEWRKCAPEIDFEWTSKRLCVSSSQSIASYLLKSNRLRCEPAQHAVCRLILDDLMGEVGFGVLDESESRWLKSGIFSGDKRILELKFETGDNSRISLVLFGTGSPFGCTIDLEKLEIDYLETAQAEQLTELRASPSDRFDSVHPATAPAEAELITVDAVAGGTIIQARTLDAVTAGSVVVSTQISAGETQHRAVDAESNPARGTKSIGGSRSQENIIIQFLRWGSGRSRYYCQKPWTDLNNFTVDGRMDVCCIATGPSQEHYQLGNLNRHRFQEIWNGPMARTFRRTVNQDPLPPCQRCPMLGAFQGAGFDPDYTVQLVAAPVRSKLTKLIGSELLGRIAEDVIGRLLIRTIFKGFQRAKVRTRDATSYNGVDPK